MPPGTSQKNGVVEGGFATLYSQMCAMMMQERLHYKIKTSVWTKCETTMTKIENIIVNTHEEKMPTRRSMEK